jgi:signal transduction histidine kinase
LKSKGFSYGAQIPLTILVITIVVASIGVFFYLESLRNEKIENTLLEQEKLRQIRTTISLAQNIGSDFEVILTRLELLADTEYMQQGDFGNEKLLVSMNEQKQRINEIAPVDYLFVNDKDGISRINLIPEGAKSFVGTDFSSREYFQEAKETLRPIFSDGYLGVDGIYRITVAQPIVNGDTSQFLGIVGVSMPTVQFFEHYGNVHNVGTQFLVAFDKNANILATPSSDLIGKNFFGEEVQSNFQNNEQQIQDYRALLEGRPSSSIGDFGRGERIATREPVFVIGKPEYFIAVSTPTATITTQLNDLLFEGALELFVMLTGVLAGVIGLIAVMARWNKSLKVGITKRTNDLDQSNKQLREANEQLQIHDKLQKEFVNIAAHELRTPIQPLIGAAELMESQLDEKDRIEVTRPEIEMILRNAKRLERLSSDILEISRIESGALKLNRETFSLAYIVAEAVKDSKAQQDFDPSRITIVYQPDDIFIDADREKITQVITNILTNAIKFTKHGIISINTTRHDDSKMVEVSVRDTGSGIDTEIMPRLFEKFVTKSEKGTGIGLYISKKIVEAHGGIILGENNADGPGATFRFTLPLAREETRQSETSSHGENKTMS